MCTLKDEKSEVMSISKAIDKWLANPNHVFIAISDNHISFLCIPQDVYEYQFNDFRGCNICCKSRSKKEFLTKFDTNECQYYLFKDFEEFMDFAKGKGFNY